jgi:hypothetical protein
MLRLIFLATFIALCGCNRPSNGTTPVASEAREPVSIPFERAAGFRDGYLLQVPRNGPLLWNGIPVDAATLSNWVRQYAQAKGSGRLWIEFEPRMSGQRKEWVRRQVINSGLCAQRRCTETDWNAKWSVVN